MCAVKVRVLSTYDCCPSNSNTPCLIAGRLVVHKPDLPPSFGPPAPPSRLGGLGPLPAGLSPRASRGASVAALREYSGPNAFAIPGNHGESFGFAASCMACWEGTLVPFFVHMYR